jgi:glycosyltransferase involved in cell wall biosynthesis
VENVVDILFVITRLAVGGAPQNVLTTIRGLDRSRYRIALATGIPAPEEGSLIEEARGLDIDLHVLPELTREIHPIRDARALLGLLRLVRRGRYQVVHTHISKAGILGRLAAWWAGVPVIVHTCHGDVFDEYFGPLKSAVLLAVERLTGRVTDRFVVVSQALRGRFRQYRVGRQKAFSWVPNGIWTAGFATPSADRPGNRVGTVAMLAPIKRLDLFLEVARRVLSRRPETEFLVVGGGPDEAALRESATDLGTNVRFLGVRYDVPILLNTLDIFLLCSDYEGMPVTLIEAMVAGVPPVATSVGGVPEVVEEGRTGYLAPQGDVAGLADAVVRLLDDERLRREMGDRAREEALRRFPAEAMIAQLDALYTDLLKGAHGG